MHKTYHFLIAYSYISGSFISYMHFMFLFHQPAKRSSHGNNVVVRVRRENYDTFRIWFGAFGTVSVVRVGFTARPSGNGMLQIVKDFNVYVVCGTVKRQKFA